MFAIQDLYIEVEYKVLIVYNIYKDICFIFSIYDLYTGQPDYRL